MDRVCSLRKNTIRSRTTKFCIYVQPVLHQVLCSNETNPKCTQTVRNTPKQEFRVQLGEPPPPPPSGSRGSAPPWPPRTPKEGARAGSTLQGHRRERDLFQGLPGNFPLILSFQPTLHWLSCSNETMQNAPKHYEMHQIKSLGSNGVDRVRSLRKNSDATS